MTTKAKTKPTFEIYDFANDDQVDAFEEKKVDFTDLNDYLRTGECNVIYGDKKILSLGTNEYVVIVTDGQKIIAWEEHQYSKNWISRLQHSLDQQIPAAFIVSDKNPKKIIVNGDTDDDQPESSLVDELNINAPTTSFVCLQRFYNETLTTAFECLASGELKLVDYTSDEYRTLSAEDKKILKRKKNNIPYPPETGFTLINETLSKNARWHRSGTTLFFDKKRNMCILLGQDEGTYFAPLLKLLMKL
jgi:hypothetical protein